MAAAHRWETDTAGGLCARRTGRIGPGRAGARRAAEPVRGSGQARADRAQGPGGHGQGLGQAIWRASSIRAFRLCCSAREARGALERRSEEHTSELQSLMRISYAVFCLKKK